MKTIKKRICNEELKSRIPALFAYLEANDAGEFILHKATDSLQGCYDKIVANIKLPEDVKLIVGGEVLLGSLETYSYRTLMNYYYQYRDFTIPEGENETQYNFSFIDFIDSGIGKVEVELQEELTWEECDLVPHYIYLSNIKKIFSEYSKLNVIYHYYVPTEEEEEPFDINTLESDICCKCKKYLRMGGDAMYSYFKGMLNKADDIANTYLKYVDEEDSSPSITLGINLQQSSHDNGYLSAYLNNWVGGEKHYKGEFYTFDGDTYIFTGEDGTTDKLDASQYRYLTPYEASILPDEDERYFVLVRDAFSLGEIDSENSLGTLFKIEGGDKTVLTYKVIGYADSKLKSLRRIQTFVNAYDEVEEPSDYEDWLFYYRIGEITSYSTITDDLGNIISATHPYDEYGNKIPAGTNLDDLMAYGNVITNITYDITDRTITFEYVLNAHLEAKRCIQTQPLGSKNTLYFYDQFYYNKSVEQNNENNNSLKNKGIKYTETYNYEEGSELDKLIRNLEEGGPTFEEYVNDLKGEYRNYKKYAFNLEESYYTKKIDTEVVTVPYLPSKFEGQFDNSVDYMYSDIIKEEYLNGITYKPEVENDVRISRGNYAAFERHLKLGECKTMEDLANYSNNSFFNIKKAI